MVYFLRNVKSLLLLLATVSSTLAFSQFFVDINAGITGVAYGSAMWGDYDNDKDLDLLIAGANASGAGLTKIYRNDNGSFTDINANLEGFQKCAVAWGDFDNDGDLDILLSGENMALKTLIYENKNGQFEELPVELPYFGGYSYICWADFDNDGDLDFFISGDWNSNIFRNDGNGVFTDIEAGITGLNSPRADWGDYDNDGFQDLLLTGDTGGGMVAYIYHNDAGKFVLTELEIQGLSAGSVQWGDYDNDGDPDILIMGFDDNFEPMAEVYRNDGDNVFTPVYAGLSPVAMGNATWGDFDNDGDLDILITGKISGCGTFTSAVYENVGNDYFNMITQAGLTAAQNSFAAWGDFDNDGDLDIVLCGQGNGPPFTKIYRNEAALLNNIPTAPDNLHHVFHNDYMALHWDKATDMETPQEALTYNIRIGTFPGGNDIVPPMAHSDDGFRTIVGTGNCGNLNQYHIYGLAPGEYFWSVQTLDNTFSPSGFAPEKSFTIGLTGFHGKEKKEDNWFSVYPNPVVDHLIFEGKTDVGAKQPVLLQLWDSHGSMLEEFANISGSFRISATHLPPGVYHLLINNGRSISGKTFIISR